MRVRLLWSSAIALLFLSFLLTSYYASAQQAKRISGNVTDSLGKGIPNVTVSEKGTKNSTATNTDGSFVFGVTGTQPTLVFTSIGYTSQEIAVGSETTINVRLVQSSASLGEVVVVG